MTTIAIPTDFTLNMIQGSDGNLYSTSGTPDEGCPDNAKNQCSFIYKTTPSGTISTFHAFQEVSTTLPVGSSYITNVDGLQPSSFFEGADGNFYGACESGGPYGLGTIFKIAPNGTFTLLYAFPTTTAYGVQVAINGGQPNSLIQGSDGNLYGTSLNGQQVGVGNGGMFFQLTTAGVFTVISYFPLSSVPGSGIYDFPDGDGPTSILQGDNGNFYISMNAGSGAQTTPRSNLGAINEITLGGQVTQFFTFPADGSEGVPSTAPLVEGSDGSMYGTTNVTINNPNNYPGLIYKLSPSGVFTSLYQFTGGANGINITNNGLFPGSDGNFYGVTNYGGNTTLSNCVGAPLPAGTTGPPGCGTFFQLQPSGTLTTMYAFSGGMSTTPTSGLASANGAHPLMPIVQGPGGVFYGVTVGYGATGVPVSYPTVYSLALTQSIPSPVQLSFSVKGQPVTTVTPNTAVTLTWNVLNAFSLTAQQCHASITGTPVGAGTWSGPQTGALKGNVYTGTAQITPTVAGFYTYVLNCGGVEVGSAGLSVSGITITTGALPDGTVSKPYLFAVEAVGGVLPYTWGHSADFPDGLVLNSSTGEISGTPVQFGTYQVTIIVEDSSNQVQNGTQAYTVNIASGLMLTPSLNNAVVGTEYNATATATGGLPPYKWALASGALPDGLALNNSNGVISGTPTKVASYTFAIKVSDNEGTPATLTQSYAISTAIPPMEITPGNLPACTVNVPCSGQFEVTGGLPPYTWAPQPRHTLPAGLTLRSNGTLSGTPTQSNIGLINGPSSLLLVQVTDSEKPPLTVVNGSDNGLDILSGLNITSLIVPVATVGEAYQAPPPVATGGIPPYKWAVQGPSAITQTQGFFVPSATGILQSPGPTQTGTYTLLYTVSDAEGIPASSTRPATLTIQQQPVTSTTVLTSSNTAAGAGMSVTLTATVTATGGIPVGNVTFYKGSTSLGSVTLNATGSASFNTSFSSPGVYTLTAQYSGGGATAGSVSASITETIVTPAVSASVSPVNLTIASGSSGTLTITVTPTGGYAGTVNFSCGTLPQNVTCTFVPPSLSLNAGSGPVTDTLTIHTSTQSAMLSPLSTKRIDLGLLLWPPGLGMSFYGLFRNGRRKLRARGLLMLAITCLGLAGLGTLAACGGAPSQDVQAGTYSIPVTLTLASGATQTVSATVVVQ